MDFAQMFSRLFFGSGGDTLQINFSVDGKEFSAIVPSDQLFLSVKDILLNREYEFIEGFNLSKFRGKTIVDAGAHAGLFSLVASAFAKKVISIEPAPSNFALLGKNISKNNAKNIILLKKALAGKSGASVPIYSNSHSAAFSPILSKNSRLLCRAIPITLEKIASKYGNIDLLKIDIEGGEFDVFSNASSKALSKISNIVGEIHEDAGDCQQIVSKLEQNGFKVRVFSHPICSKNLPYKIELKGFQSLKISKNALYAAFSLIGYKSKSLKLIFATRS